MTLAVQSIRRVLVPLDSGDYLPSALESAVEFAARLGAELTAVFVEDVDLLRAAGLPFVRQINLLTGMASPCDPVSLEEDLRLRAERARKHLAAAASRRRTTCAFRTVRGRFAQVVALAAGEADLLVVLASANPALGDRPLQELIPRLRCPVLVMH